MIVQKLNSSFEYIFKIIFNFIGIKKINRDAE